MPLPPEEMDGVGCNDNHRYCMVVYSSSYLFRDDGLIAAALGEIIEGAQVMAGALEAGDTGKVDQEQMRRKAHIK